MFRHLSAHQDLLGSISVQLQPFSHRCFFPVSSALYATCFSSGHSRILTLTLTLTLTVTFSLALALVLTLTLVRLTPQSPGLEHRCISFTAAALTLTLQDRSTYSRPNPNSNPNSNPNPNSTGSRHVFHRRPPFCCASSTHGGPSPNTPELELEPEPEPEPDCDLKTNPSRKLQS